MEIKAVSCRHGAADEQVQDITERKKAEQALRESEERFRSLATLSSDWYWEQDEHFRFTAFPGAEQAGPWRHEQTLRIGQRRWDLHGFFPLRGTWEEHRAVLEAHQPFYDFQYMRAVPGEQPRYLSTSGEPVFDAGGRFRGYRGTARDITQSKLAEQRLRDTEALLHMAAQVGRLGAWAYEVGQPRMTWSEEVCAIHGVRQGFAPTLEEAVGFCAAEYQATMRTIFNACLKDGSPFDVEAQVTTAKGRRAWVRTIGEAQWDERGRVVRLQGACQDTTESNRAAEDARMVAEQLTTTLESLTDAFFTVDRRWRFTYLNAEAERSLRRNRTELLGQEMWKAFPASRQGLAIYARDVTERIAAQQEILRLNAELEERVKQRTAQLQAANQELEAFSYSIAHDLRAPLSSIDGFSLMLEQAAGKDLAERCRHFLSRIRAGVKQMGELTDGLLSLTDLSRASLRSEAVDLAALARAAVASCRERSPQRQADFSIAPALPVSGDPRLLAQVVGNLVGNAWKFTGRRERARIDVGSLQGEGGGPVYFVRDNGAGFDMAYASRMFEAFQRMHSPAEFEGTGIGLAIVHKIVTRHGGRIWAESAPEQGATFYFTLSPGSHCSPCNA